MVMNNNNMIVSIVRLLLVVVLISCHSSIIVVDAIPRGSYQAPLNLPVSIPHNNGALQNIANGYVSKGNKKLRGKGYISDIDGDDSDSDSDTYTHSDLDNIDISNYIVNTFNTFKDGGVDIAAIGEQEVPPIHSNMKARLLMEFDVAFSRVEFRLDVYDGADITEAQLHCASAGSNGPIISYLYGLDQQGVNVQSGTLSFGILTNDYLVDHDFEIVEKCGVPINNIASLYEAIMQRKVYLNIKTRANPSGEVRGQLLIKQDGSFGQQYYDSFHRLEDR